MAYQVDAAVIATQLHEPLMQRRARQADLAPEFIPRWHDRIAGLSADGLRCALHGRAARHADARRTALKMDAAGEGAAVIRAAVLAAWRVITSRNIG